MALTGLFSCYTSFDMDAATENLFLSFKKLIHALSVGKNAARQYGSVALFKAEVHILEIVGKRAGVTVSDIAQMMEVTKGAVSQIVTKLVRKKLVEKRMIAGNMRAQELHLTPKGQAAFYAHEEHERKLVESIAADLAVCGEKELHAFAQVVGKLSAFVGE